MQLHDEFENDVECLTFSLDFDGDEQSPPESHEGAVLEVLENLNATCRNIISSDPDSEIYETLELASIPAVLVFDKQGKLHKRFDNETGEYGDSGYNYHDHIEPVVRTLLTND